MWTRVIVLLLSFSFAFDAPEALAVQLFASRPMDMRLARLAGMRPGAPLRLSTTKLGEWEGSFLGSRCDSLVVLNDLRETTIPLATIQSLSVTRRNAARGAVIGSLTGAALGCAATALLVEVACAVGDEPCEPGEKPRAVITGTVIGAFGGSLIGAGIGYTIKNWVRRFDAPGEPLAAVSGFDQRTRVCLKTLDQGKVCGLVLGSRGDTLSVLSQSGTIDVGLCSIDSVWVRGPASARGAKWGAICAGALGALMGVGVAVAYETGVFGTVGSVAGLSALGCLVGGEVGYGIGSLFQMWHCRCKYWNPVMQGEPLPELESLRRPHDSLLTSPR